MTPTPQQMLAIVGANEGLAARLEREHSISQSQLSRWKHGRNRMSLESQQRLEWALRATVGDDVVDGEVCA